MDYYNKRFELREKFNQNSKAAFDAERVKAQEDYNEKLENIMVREVVHTKLDTVYGVAPNRVTWFNEKRYPTAEFNVDTFEDAFLLFDWLCSDSEAKRLDIVKVKDSCCEFKAETQLTNNDLYPMKDQPSSKTVTHLTSPTTITIESSIRNIGTTEATVTGYIILENVGIQIEILVKNWKEEITTIKKPNYEVRRNGRQVLNGYTWSVDSHLPSHAQQTKFYSYNQSKINKFVLYDQA